MAGQTKLAEVEASFVHAPETPGFPARDNTLTGQIRELNRCDGLEKARHCWVRTVHEGQQNMWWWMRWLSRDTVER